MATSALWAWLCVVLEQLCADATCCHREDGISVTLPHCAFALLEFDRRTTMCDYFLPKFSMTITSGPDPYSPAVEAHKRCVLV